MANNNLFDDNGLGFGAPRRAAAPAGAGLSAVFQKDASIKSAGNQSLSYTAVKPKKAATPSPSTSTPTPSSSGGGTAVSTGVATGNVVPIAANSPPVVLHACPVALISYDANRKSVPLGQRGCALLRAGNTFSLVCYEFQSQRQECTVTIGENFQFNVATDRYATFYDDKKLYWCIQPTSDEHLYMLARHIAMVKNAAAQLSALSNGTSVGLIYQDLTSSASSSSDASINNGDRVGVKYSMYLTSSTHPKSLGTSVGTVGNDKPRSITVGDRKELAGLEQGLIGMKKGQRRFLVIPPSLAYGNKDSPSIPANSTILIEVLAAKHRIADRIPAPSTATASASSTVRGERSSSSASGAPPLLLPNPPSALFPSSVDDFDDNGITNSASSSTLFATNNNNNNNNDDDDTPPLKPQPTPVVTPSPLPLPNIAGTGVAPSSTPSQAPVVTPSLPSLPSSTPTSSVEEDAARSRLRARVTGMGVRMPFNEPATHAHDQSHSHGHGHDDNDKHHHTGAPSIMGHTEALFGSSGTSQSHGQSHGHTQQPIIAPHAPTHGHAHNHYGYAPHLQPGAPSPSPLPSQSPSPSGHGHVHGSYPSGSGVGHHSYGTPGGPSPHVPYTSNIASHAHADIFAGISSPSPVSSQHVPHVSHVSHVPHVSHASVPVPTTGTVPPVSNNGGNNGNGMTSADVHSKLDGIYSEVKQLNDLHKGLSSNLGYEQRVTGTQVIQALTALVKERDRLQAASDAATLRVTEMQSKISELHERNEKYMSEHTSTMQKRYDAFQDDAKRHNQQIMDLREDKRRLAEELNAAKLTVTETSHRLTLAQAEVKREQLAEAHARELESKVAGLTAQLELVKSSQTHREAEVRSELVEQISALTRDHELAKARVTALTEQLDERSRELVTLQSDLRTSRATIKSLQDESVTLRNTYETDTNELRSRHQTLEASFADVRTSYTRDMEEAKQRWNDDEQRINELTRNIESLTADANAIRGQLVAVESSIASIRIEEYERGRRETAELARKQMEDVVSKARARVTDSEARVTAAIEEKDNIVSQSRQVIANLKTQAAARITAAEQLAADNHAALLIAQTKASDAIAAAAAAAAAASATVAAPAVASASAGPSIDDVKKLMSRVYFTAAAAFVDDASYSSDDIKIAVRNAIKSITLEMVAQYATASSSSSSAVTLPPSFAAPATDTPPVVVVSSDSVESKVESHEATPLASSPESIAPSSSLSSDVKDTVDTSVASDNHGHITPVIIKHDDIKTSDTSMSHVGEHENATISTINDIPTMTSPVAAVAVAVADAQPGDAIRGPLVDEAIEVAEQAATIVSLPSAPPSSSSSDVVSGDIPSVNIDEPVVSSGNDGNGNGNNSNSNDDASEPGGSPVLVATPNGNGSAISDTPSLDAPVPIDHSIGNAAEFKSPFDDASSSSLFPTFDDHGAVITSALPPSMPAPASEPAPAPTPTPVDHVAIPGGVSIPSDTSDVPSESSSESATAIPSSSVLPSAFDENPASSAPSLAGDSVSSVLPPSGGEGSATEVSPHVAVDEVLPVVLPSTPTPTPTVIPVAAPVPVPVPAPVATTSASAVPAKRSVSSLFGDHHDDGDDGTDSLFVISAAAPPPSSSSSSSSPSVAVAAAPKVAAKKSSLFGDDDDDDDGGLFAKPSSSAAKKAPTPTVLPWD